MGRLEPGLGKTCRNAIKKGATHNFFLTPTQKREVIHKLVIFQYRPIKGLPHAPSSGCTCVKSAVFDDALPGLRGADGL
jgi:hypothetical protein